MLVRWTARVALALYAVAMACWLSGRQRRGAEWLAGLAWTAGCGFCLVHVATAFHFYHHWSHAAAYREIARQTAELLGFAYGGGIYFNYAFALAWVTDVLRWWQGPKRHSRRARALRAALHVFLAFIVFNATVIFKTGALRWLGLAATVSLLLLWRRNPRAIETLLTSSRPNS